MDGQPQHDIPDKWGRGGEEGKRGTSEGYCTIHTEYIPTLG